MKASGLIFILLCFMYYVNYRQESWEEAPAADRIVDNM